MHASKNTLASNQNYSRNQCTIPIRTRHEEIVCDKESLNPILPLQSPPHHRSLHPHSLQHTTRSSRSSRSSQSSCFQQTLPTNQILLHERPGRIPPRKPPAIERTFLHTLRLPINLLLLLSHLHQNRPRKPKSRVVHHVGGRELVYVLVGLQRSQRADDSLRVPRRPGNPLDMMGGIAKGEDVALLFEILYDELIV